MTSLAGHLLVAPPHERDLDFIRTVILLVQHSEEQAVGLVLNRPTDTPLKKAWRGRWHGPYNPPTYGGGPVPGPIMALHTAQVFGELEILPGIYYSVQKGHLERLMEQPPGRLKVFASHAGWGPGQLEQFLAAGPWLVLPATAERVFCQGPGLWEEVSKPATA
jgi:putative transcriptional regulator